MTVNCIMVGILVGISFPWEAFPDPTCLWFPSEEWSFYCLEGKRVGEAIRPMDVVPHLQKLSFFEKDRPIS